MEKDLCMRTFKRLICALLIFSVTFTSVSAALIVPFLNSEREYYQDVKLRRKVAGTIDCVVLGASQGNCAFAPEILDSKLGYNSYNLSSSLMPMHARKCFLEKELTRNDIKTVIIELSYNALSRNLEKEHAEGDVRIIERLDSVQERFSYLCKYVKFDDWLNIYSRLFLDSVNSIETCLTKGNKNVDYQVKGFNPQNKKGKAVSYEEAQKLHNTEKVSVDSYNETNIEQLTKIIDICKSNDIRVIIAVVPLSDSFLWKYENMDSFFEWAKNYSCQHNCEFYDFNLLKSRYNIFNEENSWTVDSTHMRSDSAKVFSAEFSNVIHRVDLNEDVSDLFYSSYKELLKDSPYNS